MGRTRQPGPTRYLCGEEEVPVCMDLDGEVVAHKPPFLCVCANETGAISYLFSIEHEFTPSMKQTTSQDNLMPHF